MAGEGWMKNEVILREVLPADLPIFYNHQMDPVATRMAAFPSRDIDAFNTHWQKIIKDNSVYLRTILYNGIVAGNIVCWEHDGEREVGYWLGQEFWGMGIATLSVTEFLKVVAERPLFAHVARHNAGSLRVL